VIREVESGISSKVSLGQRLQERWSTQREMTPGDWAWPAAIVAAAVLVFVLLSAREGTIPMIIVFG
jgi:hypothetical protein